MGVYVALYKTSKKKYLYKLVDCDMWQSGVRTFFSPKVPCSSKNRDPTRYRRGELEKLSKKYGIELKSNSSLTTICSLLREKAKSYRPEEKYHTKQLHAAYQQYVPVDIASRDPNQHNLDEILYLRIARQLLPTPYVLHVHGVNVRPLTTESASYLMRSGTPYEEYRQYVRFIIRRHATEAGAASLGNPKRLTANVETFKRLAFCSTFVLCPDLNSLLPQKDFLKGINESEQQNLLSTLGAFRRRAESLAKPILYATLANIPDITRFYPVPKAVEQYLQLEPLPMRLFTPFTFFTNLHRQYNNNGDRDDPTKDLFRHLKQEAKTVRIGGERRCGGDGCTDRICFYLAFYGEECPGNSSAKIKELHKCIVKILQGNMQANFAARDFGFMLESLNEAFVLGASS